MPIDAAGYPQMPSDLGTLGRRLVQLERQVQLGGGARTMVKASVGRGGIRVTKEGSITVEGGGSVIIETGNLVLGDGMIDGSALRHQLEADGYSETNKGFSLGASWKQRARISITAPSWATSTVVQGFGIGQLRVRSNIEPGQDINADIRVAIDGQAGPENAMVAGFRGTRAWSTASVAHSRKTTSRTFNVDLQMKARENGTYPTDSVNSADLRAIALFMR